MPLKKSMIVSKSYLEQKVDLSIYVYIKMVHLYDDIFSLAHFKHFPT